MTRYRPLIHNNIPKTDTQAQRTLHLQCHSLFKSVASATDHLRKTVVSIVILMAYLYL